MGNRFCVISYKNTYTVKYIYSLKENTVIFLWLFDLFLKQIKTTQWNGIDVDLPLLTCLFTYNIHNKYTGFLQRLVLYTGIGQVQLAPLHTKFSKMFRPIIQNSKNLTHGKKKSHACKKTHFSYITSRYYCEIIHIYQTCIPLDENTGKNCCFVFFVFYK